MTRNQELKTVIKILRSKADSYFNGEQEHPSLEGLSTKELEDKIERLKESINFLEFDSTIGWKG